MNGFSIVDVYDFKIIKQYNNSNYLIFDAFDMKVSNDNYFLFIIVENFGIRILDISDYNNIQIALDIIDQPTTTT